jgi:hypothetical protein
MPPCQGGDTGSSPVIRSMICNVCRGGGTGIRTGLKILRRKACGFDSRPRHQKGKVKEVLAHLYLFGD